MVREVDKIRLGMFPKISLTNAALCIQQGRKPEPDNVCEIVGVEGDIDPEALKPLLLAVGNGTLQAKGHLARVRIDIPEFNVDTHDAAILQAHRLWRAGADFELGLAQEDAATVVPPAIWSPRTVIWERSTVWVLDPQDDFRKRCKALKPFPARSEDPPQPFEREDAICFREVAFAVDELTEVLASSGSSSRNTAAVSTAKNPRNAGRKAKGQWEIIAPYLREQIETNPRRVWDDWGHLMAEMEQYIQETHQKTSAGASDAAFKEWLRTNDAELLANLRERIKTSRSYRY